MVSLKWFKWSILTEIIKDDLFVNACSFPYYHLPLYGRNSAQVMKDVHINMAQFDERSPWKQQS